MTESKPPKRMTEDFSGTHSYARDYLRTFFLHDPVPDEQVVMRFLAEEYAKLDGQPALLEIGCGPIVNHVLSAVPSVSEIHMADLRDDNLEEIRKWKKGDPDAHSWVRFTRFALEVEGRDATDEAVEKREREARQKITRISTCDLRRPHPLGQPAQYPVVCCFYTTEQASRDRDEWAEVFANLAGLVAPGGKLFCCAIGHTDHYVLYGEDGTAYRYAVPELTAEDFAVELDRLGFDLGQREVRYEPLSGQENEGVYGVILVAATRGPAV